MTSKEKLNIIIRFWQDPIYDSLMKDLEVLEILKKCLYINDDGDGLYVNISNSKLQHSELVKIETWLNR